MVLIRARAHTHTHTHTHTQLQFEKGDLITVMKMVDGGWWEGVCNGKVGWFPGNYVEEFQGGKQLMYRGKLLREKAFADR